MSDPERPTEPPEPRDEPDYGDLADEGYDLGRQEEADRSNP